MYKKYFTVKVTSSGSARKHDEVHRRSQADAEGLLEAQAQAPVRTARNRHGVQRLQRQDHRQVAPQEQRTTPSTPRSGVIQAGACFLARGSDTVVLARVAPIRRQHGSHLDEHRLLVRSYRLAVRQLMQAPEAGDMTLANSTDLEALGRRPAERFTLAIVGDGARATSLVRMLANSENVVVAAVCSQRVGAPSLRLAEELGIYATRDVSELFQVPDLDIVLDASEDPQVHARLVSQRPPGLEVLDAMGSRLVSDLLVAKKRGEEHERLFVELQVAYDKIRSHERRLESSKEALQRANARARGPACRDLLHTRVLQGARELHHRRRRLFADRRRVHGHPRCGDQLRLPVQPRGLDARLAGEPGPRRRARSGRRCPVSETILGQAFREGVVQEVDAECQGPSTAWLSGECDVRSQAAVALRAGDEVLGVVVLASTERREFAADGDGAPRRSRQPVVPLAGERAAARESRAALGDRPAHRAVQPRLLQAAPRGGVQACGPIRTAALADHVRHRRLQGVQRHLRAPTRRPPAQGGERLSSRENLRTIDIAARYGGEEFVVVLPETDTAGAIAVGERIREGVESLQVEGPESAPVLKTVSVGVATFPHHAASALRLLEAADAAMYRAKRAGKNRVISAGPE